MERVITILPGTRWSDIWPGYLRIEVKGKRAVKFLNLTARHNIYFWDLEHDGDTLFLKIRPGDFKKLRPLLRKTGNSAKIIEKKGSLFLMLRGWQRKGLLVGILMFIFLLYFFSLFIWNISIEGNNEVSREDILAFLEKYKVKRGTLQGRIDLQELERKILLEIDELVWAGLRIQGTSLEIQVVERFQEPKIAAEAVDLVAAKDGVVVDVLVLAGEAVVEPGDTVQKGDLLISGTVTPPEIEEDIENDEDLAQQAVEVQARGIVEAMVWYEEYVAQPLYIMESRKTGRQTRSFAVKINSHRFSLGGANDSPFKNYELEIIKRKIEWRNLSLPVELVTSSYREIEMELWPLSPWEALNKARSLAVEKVNSSIPRGVSIKKRYVDDYYFFEIGRVGCRVMVETLEDIAVPQIPLT